MDEAGAKHRPRSTTPRTFPLRMRNRLHASLPTWILIALALTATACCGGKSKSTAGGTASGDGIGSPAAGSFRAGDKVDVEWNGSWWQAKVLSTTGGLYRVHYVGWQSSWDENVIARRVRPSSGTAKRGALPN